MEAEWLTQRRLLIFGGGAAALVVLGIVAPEIYTGTFSDVGTLLRVVLVIAVLAGWAIAVRRLVPHETAATALAIAPALAAAAVFVWPYVRPATEVDEAFPPVATSAALAATTTTQPPPTAVATTLPDATTVPTAPDTAGPSTQTALESSTSAAPAAPVTTTPAAPATTTPPTTTTASTTTTTTTTTTVPAGPVELRRAGFQGLTGHRGSGDAALYDLGGGTLLLRFEDVDIGSGPELEVYLVPGSDRRGLSDAVYVAPLTAERGNQNYDVPAGIEVTSGAWTVLVWCETFDVEVANASF